MSFQLFQFASILVFVLLIYGAYRIKNKKVKVFLVALVLVLFFANPIRFKQEGVVSIERFKVEKSEIPERVFIEQNKFNEFQKQEHKSLKNESKELINETIN